jgi:hypothetical protein
VKTSSILMAALASGLLFLPLAQGVAAPSGAGVLKSLTPAAPAVLTLVKGGGGGGGGGHMGGGGGGGHMGGGHMGGAGIHMGGVGAYGHMSVGGHHGMGRGNFALQGPTGTGRAHMGRSYAGHSFDQNYGTRGHHHGAYAWNHDNWNGHHRGRHYRRFYGPYIYGGGYGYYDDYGYDDCYWLRRQAIITGSPVWWRRYYACAG